MTETTSPEDPTTIYSGELSDAVRPLTGLAAVISALVAALLTVAGGVPI